MNQRHRRPGSRTEGIEIVKIYQEKKKKKKKKEESEKGFHLLSVCLQNPITSSNSKT
jgi:hypothetical protein